MKIVVNGREYEGIEQMPPEVRRQYLLAVGALGDADGDGVPEVLEKPGSSGVVVRESILYNGRKYTSRDELPPEVRELLERMPKPGPGENETRVEVKTTKVFPPRVSISERRITDNEGQRRGARSGFQGLLVAGLIVVVLILLFLWLSGIKPADLWRN